jgi:hypothetical protein
MFAFTDVFAERSKIDFSGFACLKISVRNKEYGNPEIPICGIGTGAANEKQLQYCDRNE